MRQIRANSHGADSKRSVFMWKDGVAVAEGNKMTLLTLGAKHGQRQIRFNINIPQFDAVLGTNAANFQLRMNYDKYAKK